jgi:hypothetical protein
MHLSSTNLSLRSTEKQQMDMKSKESSATEQKTCVVGCMAVCVDQQ